MALWIEQTLRINGEAEITLFATGVWIGGSDDGHPEPGKFYPESREEANSMSIALKLAAKRLESIGKGLE